MHRRAPAAVLAALLLCGAAPLRAEGDRAKPPAPAKPPVPAPAEDPAERPLPPRVYVPFEDLRKVFEKEGQGVFVPWKEFQDLWKAAHGRVETYAPPEIAGVVAASYDGRIEGDLALVEAVLDLRAASDGESSVPVGLGDAAIGEATLDGKPAVLLDDAGRGRRVVVRGRGPHALKVLLVAPVRPKDGDRTVAFPSAGAPVSRLSFRIPGEGVKVTVEPNLATSRTDAGGGATLVQAFVGAAKEVRLTWRPRPVEAASGQAVLQVATEVVHHLSEASLETWTLSRLQVLRGGMRSFRVRVPEADRVLKVEGANLRSWEDAVVEGGLREIRVDLHDDVAGTWELRLKLERPRAPGEREAVLPRVDFAGASRDAGLVAVQVVSPVSARPAEATGLYRVPTRELPEWMTKEWPGTPRGEAILAYRYAGGDRRLALAVETLAPEVATAERSLLDLGTAGAVLRAALDVTVERAGLFQFSAGIPAGWDLEGASAATEKGEMRPVDARVEGEGADRRAVLDLGARRLGTFEVRLVLRRPMPAGEGEQSLELPVVRPLGAARVRGLLAVSADEALDVRSGAVKGFVAAEPAVLRTVVLPVPEAPEERRAPLFAFRHAGEERSGSLVVVRRRPQVTAEIVTSAAVEEDRVRMRHAVRFLVRYAGVDAFAVSLPKEAAARARVEGPGIKERTRVPDPADATREIHAVVLQAPVRGEVLLVLDYDLPREAAAPGTSRTLSIPAPAARNVEREVGWYAVTRDPALSVEGKATGLTYADAREVPAFGGSGDAFLAWRALGHPHALDLAVVKHEPVKVLQAVVNALALDTVVGGGAVALTEARMDVQVNGLQYLRVELPAGAEIESAEVDGAPVAPRKEGGLLLLPCPPGRGRDDRFPIRLVWRAAAAGTDGKSFAVDLAAPRIPDAMVQGTAWTLWVPADATLFSGGGTMRAAGDGSVLGTILGNVAEAFGARPAPGAPTSRGGVLPPSVTLPTAGRAPFSFTRTGEDARLSARFLPWAAVGALAALAGVLALGGAVFCGRRGGSPWAMALLLGGLSLVLQPVAAPGFRPALAVLGGVAVALAVLAVLGAGLRLLRGNTALEEPPMPPLPDLPPEPPTPGNAS